MNKNQVHLTKSEEQLMNLFWDRSIPMTSVEIVQMNIKPTWTNGLVHNMIRSLLKKGMLQECGTVRYATQYARQFQPVMTKEEYAAKLALSVGILKKDVSKVIAALTKETGKDSEVIEELEEIIRQIKSGQE